jgi:hypothetical protein
LTKSSTVRSAFGGRAQAQPIVAAVNDLLKLRERRLERHLDDVQHWFGHAFSSHALFPAQIESPSHIARIRNHLRKKIRQRVDRLRNGILNLSPIVVSSLPCSSSFPNLVVRARTTSNYQVAADDLIDLACSVRSGLSGLNWSMFPGSAAKGAARELRRPRQALEAKAVKRNGGKAIIDSGAWTLLVWIEASQAQPATGAGRRSLSFEG